MKKLIITTAILGIFTFSFASDAKLKVQKVNKNEINISVDSNRDIYGLQFDVISKDKITAEEVSHAFSGNDSRSSMSVYSRLRDDGTIRVIMFDLSGQAITTSNNVETVINIKTDKTNGKNDLLVTNIVIAGEHGETVKTGETEYQVSLPQESKLIGNYPNPFNPSTTIEFNLTETNAGLVDIIVYDLQGRKVQTLYSGWLEAGYGHKFIWNASSVASGKYFAVLSAPNGFTDTVNMTLIK